MDKKVKKDVLTIFTMLLKQHFPKFSKLKAGFPNSTFFAHKINDQLTLYVVVTGVSSPNKFTVDVAWTFNDSLDNIGHCFDVEAALKKNAVILRIAHFMGKTDYWWTWCHNHNDDENADAETRCRNSPNFANVSEAFELLRTGGMPYLDRVIKLKLPDFKN